MRKQLFITFLFMLQCWTAIAQVDITLGLIGNYPFTGNADDLSPSANNGTVYGASLSTDRKSCSNASYRFDGVNDNISISSTGLNNANFSYAAWVYVDTLPASGTATSVISIGNNGGDQAILLGNNYLGMTGFIATSYHSATTLTNLTSGSLPTTFAWHHVVFTRSNDTSKLYIDGLFAAQISNGGNLPFYATPTFARIGSRASSIHWWKGRIDDVRIYNRAINLCEVQALYALDPINLNSKIIGNYPFTGNANDFSGRANNGTVSNATLTSDRNGTANSAYNFNGTNARIALSATGLNNANFTYAAWVYINSLPASGSAMGIVSIGNVAGDQSLMLVNNYVGMTGFLASSYYSSSTVGNVTSGTLPSASTWYHLAFTRTNDSTKLYINGTLAGKLYTSGNLPFYNATTLASIGSRANSSQWFNGRIDDVRIYDRALSDCEVAATYSASSVTTNPNGLTGSYYFNGNARDLSGFGNHGTVNGATLTSNRFSTANAAYDFDGTNDNISISPTGLNTPNFSYSTWIYLNSLPASGTATSILSIGNNGGDQAILLGNSYLGMTGFIATSYHSATTLTNLTSGSLPSTAAWHHVVFTRDNNISTLYIDGALAGQLTNSGNLPFYATPTFARIGSRASSIHWWNGRIDDVRIYNRAITACEVSKLFSETSTSDPGAKKGIVFSDSEPARILVYPNPASGVLYINAEELKSSTYKCTLFNAFGQAVNCTFNYTENTANIAALPKGVYILQIEAGEEKKAQKIVIE